MGFWGWPLEKKDAAENACRAALKIQSELAAIAAEPEHLLHDFQMGIGVATGNAVAGKIGTSHQVKVTAFGPVVNLAARLEGMTRLLNIPILIDKYTVERASSVLADQQRIAHFRKLGSFRPYGLSTASDVYQLQPAENKPSLSVIENYERGLKEFSSGQWSDALKFLDPYKDQDSAARFLSEFIRVRQSPKNFDGIIDLTSK
jgi:adenylate cyclase